MTRVILCGCNGKMGQVVTSFAGEDAQIEIVAGIDISGEQKNSYPVFQRFLDCQVEADVIIDFSAPQVLDELLAYSIEKKVPAVLCGTGYSKEEIEKIGEASKQVAILRSANMSLGVNILLKLVQTAAKVLSEANFDMEIVERHHNQKVDAPSGTALALADAINQVLSEEYAYTYDRSKERMKRKKKEIGISAVRGGTIVGEHEVIFAGADEVIELKHTAYSKAIFGKGALAAAKFLKGREAGMYDMSEVIG